ncbi:MAG: TlpA family protein disulfide reductase [Planctomycetes bacterium]|nr:TlpA family protein disulfide reductase [Planctomycetota bacterium]
MCGCKDIKIMCYTFLVLLIIGWCCIPDIRGDAPSIDGITLDKILLGEEIDKEDLKGHVVAVEFWRLDCPTCCKSIPHMVELAKKYGSKGFILIGVHLQDAPAGEVINFCKSKKVNYPVYQGGKINGVKFSIVPHFTLFNHKGEMVFGGRPSDADKMLEDVMKVAPDPLIGEGTYRKLDALSKKITERKELGKILATLKSKYLDSNDAEEKAEAEKLVECLNRLGNRMLSKAEAKKTKKPTDAYELYNEIAILFKGDEIGDKAKGIVEELKNNEVFQENMKADRELASIEGEAEKLKPCSKCKWFTKSCEGCRKRNPSYPNLIARANALVKKYPDSPAAEKVKELFLME